MANHPAVGLGVDKIGEKKDKFSLFQCIFAANTPKNYPQLNMQPFAVSVNKRLEERNPFPCTSFSETKTTQKDTKLEIRALYVTCA